MAGPSETREARPGHLYVVATPIGNLGDLSPRAQAVLSQVDRIAAEDTRTSGVLLAHFGIRTATVALHEHNEDRIAEALIAEVRAGRSLAVISDAGTPLISDPGFALVRAAREASVPVIAIPGPCAAVAALSVSGLATDSFLFVGFLPPKSGARRQKLEGLRDEARTLVLYESSHRIEDSLTDLHAVFGDSRRACIARELTKLHEESCTASLAELREWLSADSNRQRGEFVVVVAGAPADADRGMAEGERVLRILLSELPPSAAARAAAEISGVSRKQLYALALQAGGQGHDADGNDEAPSL